MASFSSKALATLYRPSTLSEVVEQEAVIEILKNQIKTKTFRNTALFCGPAGTGKTTCARAFAKELNKGKGHPIEIDAASNNGVENVRDIIAKAQQKSLDSEYKVFVIDECFKGDTLITTCDGLKFIKDVKPGDYIQNAVGYGKVTRVFRNKVLTNRICCVKINGVDTITTVDHLYFTEKGWICAKDLKKGDLVYANVHLQKLWQRIFQESKRSSVRLLQYGMSSNQTGAATEREIGEFEDYKILCDMWERVSNDARRYTEDLLKDMSGNSNISVDEGLLQNSRGFRECKEMFNSNEKKQSYVFKNKCSKNDIYSRTERKFSHLERAKRWERSFYESAVNALREFTYQNDIRISSSDRSSEGLWVCNSIQSRPRLSKNETCNRGGWQFPLFEKWLISRLQENESLEQFRVDSVTVFERGNNEEYFERYFDRNVLDTGELEFYDLEVDTHPSYFANGILVHNCHMITSAAWNAFLKTLEEPPANTIFIFCTTDPQKIPNTILSRVQRFEFKRISFEGVVKRLRYIIQQEDFRCAQSELSEKDFELYDVSGSEYRYTYQEEALHYLAKIADGGMRDAVTMLDKVMSLSPNITVENVIKALGSTDYNVYFDLTNAIIDCKEDTVIDIVETVYREGGDLKQFIKQYTMFLLDVNKYAIFKNFKYIQIPDMYEKQLKSVIDGVDLKFLKFLLDQINNLNNDIRWEAQVKAIVELKLLVLSRDGN